MRRALVLLVAVAAFAAPLPLFAHSVVDLALRSHVPDFLPRGETTAIEIVVDALAYDSALGVVLTIDSAGDSQFAAVSAEPAWRCERQAKHIRCTAGELVAGPHAVRIDLSVPQSENSIRLNAVVDSLGSADLVTGNNALAATSRAFSRSNCSAAPPTILSDLAWTEVPDATSYEVLAGIDGERLRTVTTTSDTRTSVKLPGGEVTWMVRARFSDCPSVDSATATFQSKAPPARLAIVTATQSSLKRPVAAVNVEEGIIIADADNGFFRYDASRNTIERLSLFGDIVAVPLAADGGMAVGPGGFLYFADRSNHVVRFGYPPPRYVYDVAGRPRSAGFADGKANVARFSSPTAVAVTDRSILFVSDSGNKAIRRIAWDGQVFDFITTTLARGFDDPAGIAIDLDGSVIVSDRGAKSLHRVTQAGTVTTIATGFNEPFGVAVDDRGNIYVSDIGDGTISRLAPNGRLTVVASGLNRPGLIAMGSEGSLWIPEEGSGRLLRGVMVTAGDRRRAVSR